MYAGAEKAEAGANKKGLQTTPEPTTQFLGVQQKSRNSPRQIAIPDTGIDGMAISTRG